MSEAKTLGNNIRILSGFPFPSTGFTSERNGHPLIRIRDLQQQDPETYFAGDYDRSFLIAKGDILVGMDGDFNAIKWQGPPSLLNQRVCKITTKDPTLLDQDFLYHSLQPQLNRIHNGTAQTTVKHLSTKDLYSIDAELPPLPEQKKIAEILSGIDIEIATLVRAKEKLERITLAYLGNAGPTDYESIELQQLCNITDGAHKTPTYMPEGVPFLRVTDIKSGQMDQSSFKFIPIEEHLELTRRCRPEKGDVLLSKNGTIGIPRLIDWDWEFSIFVSLALLKIKDRSKILPEFLEILLVSPSLTSQMFATSKQGTVTNLHLEEIRKFKIHLPPPEEQFEIVRKYHSLKSLTGNYSLLIEKKSLLKRGLSSDLLSGRKRVSI